MDYEKIETLHPSSAVLLALLHYGCLAIDSFGRSGLRDGERAPLYADLLDQFALRVWMLHLLLRFNY